MHYSLCNLSIITKNHKNLSNTFSSVILKRGYLWAIILVKWLKSLKDLQPFIVQSHSIKDSAFRFQLSNVDKAKADPRQAHWARVPPFEIFFLSDFVNFDCIHVIWLYFNRSPYTMFTICNLFSTRDIRHSLCSLNITKNH